MQPVTTSTRLADIQDLNAGRKTPSDFNISTTKGLVEYFEEDCSQITRLDLRKFPRYLVEDQDIRRISKNCTQVNSLFLSDPWISDKGASYFSEMKFLTDLDLSGSRNIRALTSYTELKSINLSGCVDLREIRSLENCKNLTSLSMSYSNEIDFAHFPKLEALTSLSLGQFLNIKHLAFLKSVSKLTDLHLLGCANLKDLNLLFLAPSLTNLDISRCSKMKDISSVRFCTQLTAFKALWCDAKDFSYLQFCKELIQLNLNYCTEMNDLSFIKRLTKLTHLNLGKVTLESNMFKNIAHCNQLMSLNLNSSKIKKIADLVSLSNLAELNLDECQEIVDFHSIARFKALKVLSLFKCRLSEITFLMTCENLIEVDLRGCKEIKDRASIQLLQTKGVKVLAPLANS